VRPAVQIRGATLEDAEGILGLYRRVASIPGGLARLEAEIDDSYVRHFLNRSMAAGLELVAVDPAGTILGEIHAYVPGPRCFAHVLSELTIAVDPGIQGRGVGRRLFATFMNIVLEEHPAISRVELIARKSNSKAIRFYRTIGFAVEGELTDRIRNLDGSFESDIPMAWRRG
jgi:ribosomal protein S18 acetylase RimI-like enzyme